MIDFGEVIFKKLNCIKQDHSIPIAKYITKNLSYLLSNACQITWAQKQMKDIK